MSAFSCGIVVDSFEPLERCEGAPQEKRRRSGSRGRAGCRAVLDNDRHLEVSLEQRLDAPGNLVRRAAGRKRHDDPDGIGRPVMHRGRAGCIQQAGQAKCKDCKRGPALRIVISWPSSSTPATCTSFGCLNAIDRGGAGLDAWDELSSKFNRVVQRVEAANEKRVDSKSVVFEDGFGDLFGRRLRTKLRDTLARRCKRLGIDPLAVARSRAHLSRAKRRAAEEYQRTC